MTELLNREFPSALESVDEAEAELMKAAEAAGFDEDSRHDIGMAFRECMVNAVVHGNKYNRKKTVRVRIESGDSLRVAVRDQGEGFEETEVPDPLHETNLLRHSGRGLFLMRAFMDEVSVHKADPSGTEVVLSKKVPPRT